jgi:isopenicillin N synthase-like dioxygenase
MTRQVPVVDLRDPQVASQVDAACREFGFLVVSGHGVDSRLIDDAWDLARRFFDLPLADRLSVAMPFPGYPYGYSPLAGETLAASLGNGGPPDRKSSFGIGPVDPPRHVFTDPDEASAWSLNQWPVALPELRPVWENYYRALADLSARLLAVMAESLQLPADYFVPLIDRHTSAMRALDYPGRNDPSSPLPEGALGAGAHTDYGTLTILLPDQQVPGLEIQAVDGSWLPVQSVPGTFIVNLGDALARWTNNRWRSTLHRVITPVERRQSIAFFHNANWDAVIECIPSCLAPGETPRFAPIEAGPHLMQKFRASVAATAIDAQRADDLPAY